MGNRHGHHRHGHHHGHHSVGQAPVGHPSGHHSVGHAAGPAETEEAFNNYMDRVIGSSRMEKGFDLGTRGGGVRDTDDVVECKAIGMGKVGRWMC